MSHTDALGVDISKAWFDVCLLQGTQRLSQRFDNDLEGIAGLEKWLRKQRGGATPQSLHVAMEATGRYGELLALSLSERGYRVSILNPARIKAHALSMGQPHKTDASDAYVIADFCRQRQPSLWQAPAATLATLRAMVRHLDALQKMRTQERNRLKAGTLPEQVVALIQQHLTLLDEQISDLKAQIQAWIDDDPDLKQQHTLLCSIVGIGALSAAQLLAELPPISGFANARALAAFAGLTPRLSQSGQRRATSRLSKAGRSSIRKALYFPALSARQHNPILRPFADRLAERGKQPMQIIAAVMRKLLHQVYGVLSHRLPFDPTYLAATT